MGWLIVAAMILVVAVSYKINRRIEEAPDDYTGIDKEGNRYL